MARPMVSGNVSGDYVRFLFLFVYSLFFFSFFHDHSGPAVVVVLLNTYATSSLCLERGLNIANKSCVWAYHKVDIFLVC